MHSTQVIHPFERRHQNTKRSNRVDDDAGEEDTPTLQSRRGSDFTDPLLPGGKRKYSDVEATAARGMKGAEGGGEAQGEIERLRAELADLKAAPLRISYYLAAFSHVFAPNRCIFMDFG